jgi:ABC-2 type transport system permease protein
MTTRDGGRDVIREADAQASPDAAQDTAQDAGNGGVPNPAGQEFPHHDHSADAAVAAMSTVPVVTNGTDSGPAPGFRPGATLPIRVELARQLHRRRTQVALGFMVLLPAILAAAFALGSDSGSTRSTFVDLAQGGAANFAMVTLFFAASFLLIVIVSLFFGDTIASEASWSSLRYLLAMPVPRIRLLRQKFVVAALLSAAAIVLLAGVAAAIGVVAYGTGPLTTPTGESFAGWGAAGRMALVVAYIAVQLAWVAGLAFLMTVSTDVPLGAVGSAVLLSIVSQILDQITALGSLRNWLPTHYSFSWTGALVDPINWADMTRGAFSSIAYGVLLTALAFWRFRRKDITS